MKGVYVQLIRSTTRR